MKKYVFSLILVLFIIFFSIGIVRGNSMKPTINDVDFILVSRYTYPIGGNIVAFRYNNELLIKRVIACDGEMLSDEYKDSDKYPRYIPKGKYFVVGDNKNESIDSRHFGCIDKSQIIGVVIFHCSLVYIFLFIGALIWLRVLIKVKSRM